MSEKLDLDLGETALIVVDMQNDFCHSEGFYARARKEMQSIGLDIDRVSDYIVKMKELLLAARNVGLFIVHTQIVRDSDPTNRVQALHKIIPMTHRATRDVAGPMLVPGSWGADTYDELKPSNNEYILVKRGFSAFYQTDLELMLRRRNIKNVVIAGTVTYACVLHTAFDAHVRDFDVVLPSDAVASWATDLQEPTLKIVDLLLGVSRPTAEIVQALSVPVTQSIT